MNPITIAISFIVGMLLSVGTQPSRPNTVPMVRSALVLSTPATQSLASIQPSRVVSAQECAQWARDPAGLYCSHVVSGCCSGNHWVCNNANFLGWYREQCGRSR